MVGSNGAQFEPGSSTYKLPDNIQVRFASDDLFKKIYTVSEQVSVFSARNEYMCTRSELKEAQKQSSEQLHLALKEVEAAHKESLRWYIGTMIAFSSAVLAAFSLMQPEDQSGPPQIVVIQQPTPQVHPYDYWSDSRE